MFRANQLAITCHWIDNEFELHEALLEFKKLSGHHTGSMLADEVYRVLNDFGIASKLFCITCDNASNNKKMMKELERKLARDSMEWNHEVHHIACLNHVINLAVEAFLGSIKVVDTSKKEDENKDVNDNQDDEDDLIDEDESDDDMDMDVQDNSVLSTEFKLTMEKIRKVVKVHAVRKRMLTVGCQCKLFNN